MSQNIQLWVELESRFYEKIQNIDNQINWLGQHIEFSRRLAFSILQSMALKKVLCMSHIQGTDRHTYMSMTNLIEIFMGKMNSVRITIKVLFQSEFPIDHFLSS